MREFLMIAAAVLLGSQANVWLSGAIGYAIQRRRTKRTRGEMADLFARMEREVTGESARQKNARAN
jgi:hypothetical protein